MSRHHTALVLMVLVAASGCGSSRSDKDAGGVQATPAIQPELRLAQISGVPGAAEHVSAAIPLQFALQIRNRSDERITLRRVGLTSVGAGAYTIQQGGSQAIRLDIEPHSEQIVKIWSSVVTSNTILGVNGPATVRVMATFDSPQGTFQTVEVQQVNSGPGNVGSF